MDRGEDGRIDALAIEAVWIFTMNSMKSGLLAGLLEAVGVYAGGENLG